MGKDKIKQIAIELDGALKEFDKSEAGNKSAGIRFRKHLSEIKHLVADLREESRSWGKKKR